MRRAEAVERGRSEEALRESEESYRSLVEGMHELFALCGLVRDEDCRAVDYRFLTVNGAFCTETGVTRDQVEGRLRSEAFPEPYAHLVETFARAVDVGEPVTLEPTASRGGLDNARVYPRSGDRLAVLAERIASA